MAISIREVTEIDRRTGRRLGLSGEKVNEVISAWAEEYLKFERENKPEVVVPTAKKAPAKKATTPKAKAAPKPPRTRQSIGQEAAATEQPPTTESAPESATTEPVS